MNPSMVPGGESQVAWGRSPAAVRIANPIYDVVFKYLLDDEKVARLLLSALLGREVLELEFRPTELHHPVTDPRGSSFLVLRVDFAARVRMEDGSRKLVLIEIQKAHDTHDIMRFRRYLGSNYCNRENAWEDPEGTVRPLPLVTIYFLGRGLENVDVPVLRINRRYEDAATGEEVRVSDPFVEALTHDSIVVQINRLKNRRRTELEKLLAVFDQGQKRSADSHLLDILVENFPERYREVLRRLERANGDQDIHERMDLEDDIVRAFQEHARTLADDRKLIADQCKVIRDKERVIEDQEKVIEEKEQTLREKEQALREKDRLIEELRRRNGLS